jgi:hypothetical protein
LNGGNVPARRVIVRQGHRDRGLDQLSLVYDLIACADDLATVLESNETNNWMLAPP